MWSGSEVQDWIDGVLNKHIKSESKIWCVPVTYTSEDSPIRNVMFVRAPVLVSRFLDTDSMGNKISSATHFDNENDAWLAAIKLQQETIDEIELKMRLSNTHKSTVCSQHTYGRNVDIDNLYAERESFYKDMCHSLDTTLEDLKKNKSDLMAEYTSRFGSR